MHPFCEEWWFKGDSLKFGMTTMPFIIPTPHLLSQNFWYKTPQVPSYITSTAQVQMWEQLVQLLLWELEDGDGGLYLGLSLWSQSMQRPVFWGNPSNRMKYGASSQPHSSGYFAWLIQRPVCKKILVSGEIFIQQPIFPLKATLYQSKKYYIFLCVTNNVIK